MQVDVRGLTASLEATFQAGERNPLVTSTQGLELRGPFAEAGEPTLYLLKNVTAGVFAGDRLSVSLRTEPGTRIHVASPSATKVHSMPSGFAESILTLEAAADSLLVYGPSPAILQAGADIRQSTDLSASPRGRLIYADVVVFGRLACGEQLAFTRFASHLSAPCYAASFSLCPSSGAPAIEAALAGYNVLGTLVALGIDATNMDLVREQLATQPDVLAGVSTLPVRGMIAKVLASRLETAQSCLKELTALLSRGSASSLRNETEEV